MQERDRDRSSNSYKPRGGSDRRGGGGGGGGGKPVLRNNDGGGGGRYDRRDSSPRNESSRYERDNNRDNRDYRGGYRSEERV